ncbi:c-type cytochrome [Bradyrhizobium sp. 195]|uniref:c-type cytochrome n=1 Tax=Bradyrhizobium sp. 195 TaxID=2782662 RepID=UPI002001A0FC|nr:c-type cytochrome [Bradyrhizobium sp. 195]
MLTAALLAVAPAACEAAGPDNFEGDARRGADLVKQYKCGACHDIPGIAGANGNVGPPLHRIGTRTYIAGYIWNSPDNMADWIEDPQKALPGNAMPKMGIPQKDARDIAAFLYTLK